MGRGLLLGSEDAGAFEHDVDAELLVRELARILDRRDLELLPVGRDHVALDLDLVRELAVHAVVAQQVGIGLDRTEIVDGDDLDIIVAVALDDGAQDVAADAAKAIDCDADGHFGSFNDRGETAKRLSYNWAATASTTAFGVMPKCS